MRKKIRNFLFVVLSCAVFIPLSGFARIKLVALPDRGQTIIRLDNPAGTLIQEERILSLQQGVNKVDFSWKGVNIQPDSIRLEILESKGKINLLNISYPPAENALVWEIASDQAKATQVRVSYLLYDIDRLVSYVGIADKAETEIDLKSFLILRNFSGEDFQNAEIQLDTNSTFEESIFHQETKRLLFQQKEGVSIDKVWTFDAQKLPWDPKRVGTNVGIPVSYRISNTANSKLGDNILWGGKARIYQNDGRDSTLFLGEDKTGIVPIGEEMDLYIGDSRDIVVTQQKMRDKKINVRRNEARKIVLYDTDEIIEAKIENFKDSPAQLLMIQYIPGEWDMVQSSHPFKKKNSSTLEFEIELKSQETVQFKMHYNRLNVR